MTTPPEPDPKPARKRRTAKKPAGPGTDLHALIASGDIRFESPEDPEVRRSRLSIEEARLHHELWRDKVLIFASLVALTLLGLIGVVFLFLPGQPQETRT